MREQNVIAYFSMEIGLEAGMPTYAGGLGVLAGDLIRAAADLRVPLVAVTLLHRKGYFHQRFDPSGWQIEQPVDWAVDDFLKEMPERASVTLEGRTIQLRSWRYEATGAGGFKVPVYFLDSDIAENSEWDRRLTDYLYGGDLRYRLFQEVILGIGGVRLLRALGYSNIGRFHMNEGHSSLLTLELLDEEAKRAGREMIIRADVEAIREKCIFTTHTPVPAGHDKFPLDLVWQALGHRAIFEMKDVFCCEDRLNMTYLALNLSHYINGVAKRHGEVSRLMFASYSIESITNGVHAATWAASPFQALYDRYMSGWRQDNCCLRSALSIPRQEVWLAHREAKENLIRYVNRETNIGMDMDVLTVGFARRAAEYKRWDLLYQDIERLKSIGAKNGGLQLVYSGKAHPQDRSGKEVIKQILLFKDSLREYVKIAFLENYDMELAKMITSGVDLWLNTPQPPMEASGTSGMKAALNGVPSLSVLDGWWIEGHIEGVTGWSIGGNGRAGDEGSDRKKDASSLYDKLEQVIIPMFYQDRDRYIDVMLHAIAINGSFFNTHRMMQQYVLNAYFR
jgi:starch phosphorylase